MGILFGWSYRQDFEDARETGIFTVIEMRSDISNLDLLASGRIDYILILEEIGKAMMEKKEYSGKFRMIYPPLLQNETYLGFNKHTNRTDLLERLNLEIRELKQTEKYDELVNQILQDEINRD
ncbi:substrate-binding periplasmic protein [Spirochaeta isovalerica]|uniref:ABC-type amino acid transport substrate-binding protein n=1 Tax=Spirochaeta isovalerica TaxID=150 RepID=A0A841RB51_9SPIO|nr:ABC-type amino acid transport substrate-binding protein [Spirochaeta isovalerica]